MKLPSSSSGVFALAIIYLSSSLAVRYSYSLDTLGFSPLTTFKYGVWINPYSSVFAYVESELINPIEGPSGVSIGQILP